MENLQWTPVRKRIMTFLERKKRLLTAKDIMSFDRRLDKVTIYRTLESFRQAGLVKELFLATGEKAYELNDPEDHHHHFRCEYCQEIYHLPCQFEHDLENWEHKTGFKFHNFDFSGLCKKCVRKVEKLR